MIYRRLFAGPIRLRLRSLCAARESLSGSCRTHWQAAAALKSGLGDQASPVPQPLHHVVSRPGRAGRISADAKRKSIFLKAKVYRAICTMPFGKCKETTKGLNKGGADLSNEELRRGHLIGLAKKGQGSDDYNFITPGVDNIAARHVCITDADQLQPVLIDQLEKGAINTGKVLWVTSVEPCYRVSAFAGLTMLVEDKDGRLAILVLYNVISANATSLDAQMIFPVGTRLGIKEPYYKLLTGRCFGLRSDNPCNVIIERPKANSTG